MAKKDPRLVTRADHVAIQSRLKLQDDEDYVITVSKGKGTWHKSIHVFSRRPTLTEISQYEQTASHVTFKGAKAQMEGSQIHAAANLYDALIARAYDVPRGVRVLESLDRAEAKKAVDSLMKREAIREFIAEVYSATRMAEAIGDDSEDDSDDPEDHTSVESADSEPSSEES